MLVTLRSQVAVVRNPWDRLVSDWHWRRKGGLPLGDLAFPAFAARACDLAASQGWDDDRADRRDFSREYRGHFKPQVAYVGGDAGVRLLRTDLLSATGRLGGASGCRAFVSTT